MQKSSEQYLLTHSSLANEALDWLEKQTNIRTNYPRMLSGRVQGELLKLLVQISGARRILEIGAFTGYSSICMASGLPAGGHIDTLEINDELEELMREAWERAGVAPMITLHIGDAKHTLAALASAEGYTPSSAENRANAPEGVYPSAMDNGGKSGGTSFTGAFAPYSADVKEASPDSGQGLYDMVFIDANKREYCEYYELVMPMLRKGGIIVADDVLWDGKVYADPLPHDAQTVGLLKFNDMVVNDPRVEVVVLPLRDGISIIRKK